MEDLINLTKATKRIHNLHTLTSGLISNAKVVDTTAKAFHSPVQGQMDFSFVGNLLEQFIGPITKKGANGSVSIPSASQVNQFLKMGIQMSQKMSGLASGKNGEALSAFSGCLVKGIFSCIIEQMKKNAERQFELFCNDFSTLLEKFKLSFPSGLLNAMNPLMEFVGSNREELNVSKMIASMTKFLTQYPKLIMKELADFEPLAGEVLNLQNIKKFMSVGSTRETKKQMIRESFSKFFKECNDLQVAFQSIVSPEFIDMILEPLTKLMDGFKMVLKELVNNLKALDEFPKFVHDMVLFLLNSDTRLVKIFKPHPLIGCFCGCFIGSPDIVAQLKAELQQLKSSINLQIVEDFIANLAVTVKQTIGKEEEKIRELIQTLEHQTKHSKVLKESLMKQQKVFDQMNGEIKYMEENIMNELDELLDSPLVKKLDEFKDKVAGVFSGIFGKKSKE